MPLTQHLESALVSTLGAYNVKKRFRNLWLSNAFSLYRCTEGMKEGIDSATSTVGRCTLNQVDP
jgi:hypothetical protein